MLAKKFRITSSEMRKIGKGQSFFSPTFSLKITKKEGPTRYSVVVSKKISKNAVVRNSLRRKVYAILEKVYKRIDEGYLVVIYIKRNFEKENFLNLEKEIINLLKQVKLINK